MATAKELREYVRRDWRVLQRGLLHPVRARRPYLPRREPDTLAATIGLTFW